MTLACLHGATLKVSGWGALRRHARALWQLADVVAVQDTMLLSFGDATGASCAVVQAGWQCFLEWLRGQNGGAAVGIAILSKRSLHGVGQNARM